MLRRIILLISFLFLFDQANCQEALDTSSILLNAKMSLLDFYDISKTKELMIAIVKKEPKYRFLESKGFGQIIFFELIEEGQKDSLEIWNGTEYQTAFFFEKYNYNFIFGYNTKNKTIYRLKGQQQNDFYILFKAMPYFIDLSLSEYDLKNKKRFLEAFYVEGLDLDCLYRSLKKKKYRCDCLTPARPVFEEISY